MLFKCFFPREKLAGNSQENKLVLQQASSDSMGITILLNLTMLLQRCVASQQSSLCACCVGAQQITGSRQCSWWRYHESARAMTPTVASSSSSPFYPLLTRWYIFAKHGKVVFCETGRSWFCWHIYADFSANTRRHLLLPGAALF